jgi:DNA-binding MarR family transcriptional regulator
VDGVLSQWEVQRPDLDFAPVGIVTRLEQVRSHLAAGLAEVFARYGLSPADFQVVVSLRRAGPPYVLPQARLMERLALTSGTVSVRLDRLDRLGVVAREPAPGDARTQLVRLTERGLALFDEIAPVHLANEDRLLSALPAAGREQLASLLRRLLVSFEQPEIDLTGPLGLRLEPARVARERRQAVGLADVPGLLVSEVTAGGPACRAGASRGDLLVAVAGQPVLSAADVRAALARAGAGPVTLSLLRGDTELTVTLPASNTPGHG